MPADRVVDAGGRRRGRGATSSASADTIGVGVPAQVRDLAARVRDAGRRQPPLRFHFHNTRNTGFANAFAAVEPGATVLDASAGGIGGCPFAPQATGNIATEDLVYLLERMGLDTGFDLDGAAADGRVPGRPARPRGAGAAPQGRRLPLAPRDPRPAATVPVADREVRE